MKRRRARKNRRKWSRLQLAIPVFVRAKDENDQELLEFATAINVSAGGALVVVRRSLPKSTAISLEIPSARIGAADGLPSFSRVIRAKAIWVHHLDDYHLMGLKFTRPLNTDAPKSVIRNVGNAASEM